ncbi:hypothetical protein GCK72_004073 [Caenorhabditis remanei]|uniref:Uncharacterized protein n=1 Tax=Caenorhabditis remanei TaxID=31234 RepID=A0A6A5HB97_CAERE|nr:hypothetical protein GCK72_004073 [Caenorhabditis remanei]KAF1764126.1 hypothetical protein GCK72_004073 [Caenorhabditis remanei]
MRQGTGNTSRHGKCAKARETRKLTRRRRRLLGWHNLWGNYGSGRNWNSDFGDSEDSDDSENSEGVTDSDSDDSEDSRLADVDLMGYGDSGDSEDSDSGTVGFGDSADSEDSDSASSTAPPPPVVP